MTNFKKVKIFMETFGQEIRNKPSFSTEKINKLRYDLIKEELDELEVALNNKDILEVADALDENGKPIYNESGKVMKGPKYFKPNLKKFLN